MWQLQSFSMYVIAACVLALLCIGAYFDLARRHRIKHRCHALRHSQARCLLRKGHDGPHYAYWPEEFAGPHHEEWWQQETVATKSGNIGCGSARIAEFRARRESFSDEHIFRKRDFH